jgi:multiple sugar transport system permease protein
MQIDNPYINVLVTAGLTVLFIIASCYGLGFLARSIARMSGASPKKQENTFAGYFFAAPWIVGFLIFVIVPLGFSLYWSFTDYRVTSAEPARWLGFENYRTILLKDSSFRASILNTLYLTVIGLPLEMAFALLLAVLLNQKMRGERVFRMSFYLPVILGFNTAVLLCWRLMLNTGTGIINQMIRSASQAFPLFSYFSRSLIFLQEVSAAFLIRFKIKVFKMVFEPLKKSLQLQMISLRISMAKWLSLIPMGAYLPIQVMKVFGHGFLKTRRVFLSLLLRTLNLFSPPQSLIPIQSDFLSSFQHIPLLAM